MFIINNRLFHIVWENPNKTYNKVKALFRKPVKRYFFKWEKKPYPTSYILDVRCTDVLYKMKLSGISVEYGPRVRVIFFKRFKFGWIYNSPCNVEEWIYWETILTYLNDPERNLFKALEDNRWETAGDGDELEFIDASPALKCVKMN